MGTGWGEDILRQSLPCSPSTTAHHVLAGRDGTLGQPHLPGPSTHAEVAAPGQHFLVSGLHPKSGGWEVGRKGAGGRVRGSLLFGISHSPSAPPNGHRLAPPWGPAVAVGGGGRRERERAAFGEVRRVWQEGRGGEEVSVRPNPLMNAHLVLGFSSCPSGLQGSSPGAWRRSCWVWKAGKLSGF